MNLTLVGVSLLCTIFIGSVTTVDGTTTDANTTETTTTLSSSTDLTDGTTTDGDTNGGQSSETTASTSAGSTDGDTTAASSIETTTAMSLETSSSTSSETAAETSSDTSAATSSETSAATPSETSAATPSETSAATPSETSAATPLDTSAATLSETSVATSSDTSAATSSNTSAATPSETSAATPSETSAATPLETSAATLSETSAATSSNTSAATPSETSAATPSETSAATPSETSAATLSETSAATSSDTSAATSSNTSAATPSETSAATPSETSGATPSETSAATSLETSAATSLKTTGVTVVITGICNQTTGSYLDGGEGPTIQCLFQVKPPRKLKITWSRGGGSISRFVASNTNSQFTGNYSTELSFATIHTRDAGNYTCKASTEGETKELEISLTVYEKPVAILSPSVLSLLAGQEQNFTCSVTNMDAISAAPAKLKWCRGDDNITDTSGIVQVSDGQEVLMITSNDTAGSYGCGVNNCSESAILVIYTANDKSCTVDKDDRNTTWPVTVGNITVKLPCQTGFVGTVKRYCSIEGIWETPDYINCVNKIIAEMEEKIKAISEGTASVEGVRKVLDDMKDVTGDTATSSAGDLDKSIDIVGQLAKVVSSTTAAQFPISEETATSFLSVVNNILSADTSVDGQWRQVQNNNSVKAASLMESVTKFGIAAAKSQKENTTLEIIRDNLVMQVGNNIHGDILFPNASLQDAKTFFTLPGSNFAANDNVTYVAAFYKTMTDFLPKNASGAGNREVNSKILALSIQVDGKEFDRLYDDITLNFEHVQSNYSEPACGYWDFLDSLWKTDGCTAKEINESYSTCQCDHLTNFAILMSPGRTVSVEHLTYLKIISIVGCSLSILGCVATIIAHSVLWRYVKSPKSIILIHLCISLTCAYTVFLAGAERTENKAACTAIAALLHYFFLSAFFLMLAQGIEIVMQVVLMFRVGSKLMILLPLAWGLPAIIVGVTLGATKLEGYGNDTFCWLTLTDGILYAFVGPVLFIILINCVIIIVIMRALWSTKVMNMKETKQKAVAGVRSLCVLMPVLGVTWVFGVLSVNEDAVVFQYLFAVFNSIQGFTIFIFHCLLNRAIQDGIRKRKYRFESQKVTNTSSFSQNIKAIEEKKHQFAMSEVERDYSVSNDSLDDSSEGFEMTAIRPKTWQDRVAANDIQRLSRISILNEARARALNHEYLDSSYEEFDMMPERPASWHDKVADNDVQRLPRVSIKNNETKTTTQVYRVPSNAEGRRWSKRSSVERRDHSNNTYGDFEDDAQPWKRNLPVFKTHL